MWSIFLISFKWIICLGRVNGLHLSCFSCWQKEQILFLIENYYMTTEFLSAAVFWKLYSIWWQWSFFWHIKIWKLWQLESFSVSLSQLNLFTFSLAQKHICSFYYWLTRQIWHVVHLHMLIQPYWRQVHTFIYVSMGTPFQPIKEYWACSQVEYLCSLIHKPENLRHFYCF